jgi:hypothetical protein
MSTECHHAACSSTTKMHAHEIYLPRQAHTSGRSGTTHTKPM